METRQKRW